VIKRTITRSQAVARIADHTASQHLWGHLTSSVTRPFDSPYAISYSWSFGGWLYYGKFAVIGCNIKIMAGTNAVLIENQ